MPIMCCVAIHIARSFFPACQALVIVALCSGITSLAPADGGEPLFAPPAIDPSPASEVMLVSTRAVGTSCDPERLRAGLHCQRLEINEHSHSHWSSYDWQKLVEPTAHQRVIVYVHGNRVSPGEDVYRGMKVYRSLCAAGKGKSLRFIIWSWPSSEVPGFIKDVHVKAARTRPAGWQLAWFLDQLPEETPVSLMGYSFGARVLSGSLHILGGGSLGNLSLPRRNHPQRPPFRVGMVAAAYDADWLQPGHFHQRALSQMEQLVLVTNHRDPAMRLYHFSVDRGRIHALGKHGIAQPQTLGEVNRRIRRIDVTAQVGRTHLLGDYLAASSKMNSLWSRLIPETPGSLTADESAQAGYRL